MILGTDKLLRLIRDKNLIQGLDEKDINIEGCGIDLRIGELYEMKEGKGFIHRDTRKTPEYELTEEFREGEDRKVSLKPGRFYVAKTIEVINTPEDLFGIFIARGTFFASGILVLGFRVDPGYKGNFRFHLVNIGGKDFEIEMGARIANMIFLQVDGKTNPYLGQWQGGRAYIKKEEKQTKQQ